MVEKIDRAGIMHPSGKTITIAPVFPNEGVQAWYTGQLDNLVREMYFDSRMTLFPVIEATPPVIAADMKPTAAGIMFTCRGRMLLLLRNKPGFESWGIPGGKIESGESAENAARRELFEETGLVFFNDLQLMHVHQYRHTRFVTYKIEVSEIFTPTLNREHAAYRWVTRDEAARMPLHPGVVAALTGQPLAMDASPTKELQMALQRWGDKWAKKLDKMSLDISNDFAARNQRATEAAMRASFKKSGFTVPFKPTRKSIEAYKAVAAEQVGLIKSIGSKYHTEVQTQVWESVKRGGDLKTLSEKLEKTYGVTRKRAALIARDQNAKAKATIEAVRHQEMGIKQAIWMHSHAGKEPRPTHVKMNNKRYDLSKGMYDSDEGEWVHPGQLINCRCTMRPFIPGFE